MVGMGRQAYIANARSTDIAECDDGQGIYLDGCCGNEN